MARPTAALLALALLAAAQPAPAEARRHRGGGNRHGVPGTVLLDGQPTAVRWTDGDTFAVDSGPLRGFSTRLVGYNALETYGPVHRIGTLGPEPLWAIARGSAALLAARTWSCTAGGGRDAYGRALVACPDAAAMLVRAGQAMVFAVDGPADPALLAAQREAQARRAGLWAGGVPPEIVTSLHSAGERGATGRTPYDRLVDTRTGAARTRPHAEAYATCQEVCAGTGAGASCLVYVPFERRYRNRPPCLGPRTPPGE
ncbi:MAG TPA: thermonuclease family protein [Anaeromyxobacteraceae bacterium]|nr:thermonuclease family protein [Anaeromyxobacteraceae bacterium]